MSNKFFKRALSKSLVTVLTASTLVIANNYAYSDGTSIKGKVKPKNTDYSTLKVDQGSKHPLGEIPTTFSITKSKQNAGREVLKSSLPSKFDLRTENRLTSIKNQGKIGSCWTFGACASMESVLKTQTGNESDFSENNILTQNGFSWFKYKKEEGGNRDMATAYVARWGGPVLEQDDPYASPAKSAYIVSRAGKQANKHVQEVLFIPDRNNSLDNDEIKSALMNYGAVQTSIHWDDYCYNDSTHAYYSYGFDKTNHSIDIVGWDDNYSRSNFSDTPGGDGAFICRNSWGSDWGENGYFYVSYYDCKVVNNTVYAGIEGADNYANIYQYDPLGAIEGYGYGSGVGWFANVFTPSSTTKSEQLKAVSFYTTKENATYQIYVDPNVDTNGISRIRSYSVKSGTIKMPGYHTIKLDTPIDLGVNNKFAIAVKLYEADEEYPIAIEDPYEGYSDDATASDGQSYVSVDGVNWDDLNKDEENSNVCLKAFTDFADSSVVKPISQIPDCVVIGTKAYSLKYMMNSSFLDEIKIQLNSVTQDDIYYKIKGINSEKLTKASNKQILTDAEISQLPEITFKDVDGKEVKYK